MIDEAVKEIENLFELDSSGHDMSHIKRVMDLAIKIQEEEGGNEEIISLAAIFHDIHRIIQNKTGKYCSPKDSLSEIKTILKKLNVEENKIEQILYCIEFHEEYRFSTEKKIIENKETLILQDADNLDAIGAIGIARGFMFAGSKNIPMWVPDESFLRETFDESKQDNSQIHHFYNKLLKLKDNMNTETGKKIAINRHKFIQTYLDQFFKEIRGEL